MLPLTRLGVPVAEIILTLMLSLRFINLVFDEVRGLVNKICVRLFQNFKDAFLDRGLMMI